MKKSAVKPLSILVVLIVALTIFGFRLSHPKDGLSNALGSAKSGIVLFHKTTNVQTGSKVIAKPDSKSSNSVLAVVVSTSGNFVDLQTGVKLVRVQKEQISGKLLVVIPFIGSVLSVVGL